MLDALESGDKFLDIFNSPPTKFSKTDHLANTVTQVQQIQKGRWVLMKDNAKARPFRFDRNGRALAANRFATSAGPRRQCLG